MGSQGGSGQREELGLFQRWTWARRLRSKLTELKGCDLEPSGAGRTATAWRRKQPKRARFEWCGDPMCQAAMPTTQMWSGCPPIMLVGLPLLHPCQLDPQKWGMLLPTSPTTSTHGGSHMPWATASYSINILPQQSTKLEGSYRTETNHWSETYWIIHSTPASTRLLPKTHLPSLPSIDQPQSAETRAAWSGIKPL